VIENKNKNKGVDEKRESSRHKRAQHTTSYASSKFGDACKHEDPTTFGHNQDILCFNVGWRTRNDGRNLFKPLCVAAGKQEHKDICVGSMLWGK
jgi:hypothetical protein